MCQDFEPRLLETDTVVQITMEAGLQRMEWGVVWIWKVELCPNLMENLVVNLGQCLKGSCKYDPAWKPVLESFLKYV